MSKISVVIPSRQPEFLNKTIEDLFEKAEEEIEVIAVLDGYWTEVDKRAITIHFGQHKGMRDGINAGVAIATGDYIMKSDEHNMFDKGFDVKLKADIEDDWVVIPRRKRLDAENWTLVEDGRRDIDYMHIDYPYQRPLDKTCGLHGGEWKQRFDERKDILIDDNPSMQGSCWFMTKKHWDKTIKSLDTEKYGTFTQEAQEIGFKTWFSGGRMVVNKKTWYAHYHKGRRGKGYGFSTQQYKDHCADMEKGRVYCINYWLYTKDYKYDWEWFITKFPDMPGWGDDWKERIEVDKKQDYSATKYKEDFWLEGLRNEK